ncbi:MAG TPA: 30S ribosomal protein S8 [Patescibacteria group bacterium]|nr:30S ribosomal protein S8 [Patescibacteria group bacterium]
MSVVSTDPIADMLARIRNALAVRKTEINLPHSKSKESIAHLLKENGYIDEVKTIDASIGKTLTLTLNSDEGNARITEIVRLSKPGRRLYTSADKMPVVKQGRGIVIVSTSKGIMTGYDARKQRVGGELICKVY